LTGKAVIIRSDARNLPLPDASVDLIVTSPPYFGLRSYRDNGEHYEGQVGSEATPQEFLQALWGCMQEWWRVLKPEGSCFVNLGDKRAGSGGHNNAGVSSKSTLKHDGRENPKPQTERELTLRALSKATRRNAPDRYNQASFGRTKSKMLIPHRFAIGCEDGLADPEGIGWVMRQDLIWQKLNGLPESVTDRHRDSHEYIFHFTKQERYFAAMDEIRQPHARDWAGETGLLGTTEWSNGAGRNDANRVGPPQPNPLGKLPGSVWPMASEPLLIPQWAKDKYGLGDHFAAFPTELPRKLILGFSPSGICVECGQPRRPVVLKSVEHPRGNSIVGGTKGLYGDKNRRSAVVETHSAEITGYACACPTPDAPTRPSVILDPFGGTGTVAMVAKGLGRIGISNDLSQDYCNLARWRIEESGHGKKAEQRTWSERQETFL
jgi:DNA modification methylase